VTRPYYGWAIVGVAALAMVGTLPGRTQGLGLVTEPLIADIGIDRVTYASLNFWATLVGALGALGIGRLIDRFGARVVLTMVAGALAVIVGVMSQVTTVLMLAVCLTATRAVGQGALSVISIAMIGAWFKARLNMAMAIYSIALSIGFMAAFPVVGTMVARFGWRTAWLTIAIALGAVLVPVAWLVVRRGPEAIGAWPDGGAAPAAGAATTVTLEGFSLGEALATPAFWIFAIGSALYGLAASGIGLFNESILRERGFGYEVYYQTLAVTAMTGLTGNFLGGWLSRRVALARLMAIALVVLAGGVAALPHVSSLAGVMVWAAAMGVGGGIVMVLFFSVWPAVFGRRELGRIQGAAQALTVLGSAIGPLLLAWCADAPGSYAAMFRILAAVISVVAVAAATVSLPVPSRGAEPAAHRAR
jgi:MFS family permease